MGRSNEISARSAAPPVLVRLAGVRKSYRQVVAIEGIDLEVRRGEFFTLLGPSGSGKTTTLRVIAGFERPDGGVIEIGGRDVSRVPPYDRNVNTVFQDYALFPHMSVRENVAYGLRAKGVARSERERRVADALRMVRLADLGERFPRQLSGGQQQRVALARAIVNRPAVLLLDEPLGALDLKLRQQMQVELKHIQEQVGITFLYVTHDQEEALTMSDRLAVFNLGRIEQVGTPAEVYEHPASEFVAGFVGTSTIIRRGGRRLVVRPEKVRIVAPDETLEEDGLYVETGRLVECVYVGMFSRFVVELEDRVRVLGVQQNLDRLGFRVIEQQGRPVQVAWRPDELHVLPEAGPPQEEKT